MKLLESITPTDYAGATKGTHREFFRRCLNQQKFESVPLLLESQGRAFEGLESRLFHASETNGLKGTSTIRSALKLPPIQVLNPKRHAQLRLSLFDKSHSLANAIPTISRKVGNTNLIDFGGHTLRQDQLALSVSRLCPLCTSDQGFGRSYWTLAPYAACEMHGDRVPGRGV